MDNNKPAMGQHEIERGRGEEKGIHDEGMGWWWKAAGYGCGKQTDRAVMRWKVREIRKEAWLCGVPQCETCQPQGPTQRWTQHRKTLKKNLSHFTAL